MDYGQAIRFPFKGEKRWKNIALISLCNLIPVVGPLVVLGYGAYVERALVRDLDAEPPLFDFDNFTKYLERGVAPFVINLMVGFALVPVIWAIMVGAMLLIAASKGAAWALIVGLTLVFGSIFTITLAVGLLLVPLNLRAMLLGSLGQAFDFRWGKDFVMRIPGPIFLSMIVLPLIAIPLGIVGLLACYIGLFFVAGIVRMIQFHIHVQLYHAYLDRGGEVLRVFEDQAPPAFPVEPRPAPPAPL